MLAGRKQETLKRLLPQCRELQGPAVKLHLVGLLDNVVGVQHVPKHIRNVHKRHYLCSWGEQFCKSLRTISLSFSTLCGVPFLLRAHYSLGRDKWTVL